MDVISYLDNICCDVILNMYNLRGVNCFCDVVRLLVVLNFILNVNKVCVLFNDCEIFVGLMCFMIFVFFVFFLLFVFGFDDGINI